MHYNGIMYRPPLEADTELLIPITEGCSHNSCRFCNMFTNIPFRMISLSEIEELLQGLSRHGNYRIATRAYLIGGDPFAVPARYLKSYISLILRYLPNISVFSMCSSVTNIKRKSDADLKELARLGVNDLYVGIETGLSDVLTFMNKGNTADEALQELLRLNKAGIRHRPLIMFGIAGKGRGKENAIATSELLNKAKPNAICATNLYIFPHTKLAADVEKGRFIPCDVVEALQEEKTLVENLNLPNSIFWAAHDLNYIRVEGKLGNQKDKMLTTIEKGIQKYMHEPFPKITHSLM